MSDAGGPLASPSNRARLVVASQGLEIQHLQEQLARKEREFHASLSALQEDKAAVEASLAQAQGRCHRLEAQVQLLGTRVRELETRETEIVVSGSSIQAEASKSSEAREGLLASLREELRTLRVRNTTLLQERDVLLERLAVEKKRSAADPIVTDTSRASSSDVKTRKLEYVCDSGTQTADATEYSSPEQVLATVAQTQPSPEAEVLALKEMLRLEQQLEAEHKTAVARHAANATKVAEALSRKVEAEVLRLAAEQDRFRAMVHGLRRDSASGLHGDGQHLHHISPAPPPRHLPVVSPISAAPDLSPLTTTSAHLGSTLEQPRAAQALTSFVQQQHDELAELRQRLAQLQKRHEEVRAVKPLGGFTALSSPPRVTPAHYHDREEHYSYSSSPDRPAAYSRSSLPPDPTPMTSSSYPISAAPVGNAQHKLSRESSRPLAAAPTTVVDRLLRRTVAHHNAV